MTDNVEFEGQILHPTWSYGFIDTGEIPPNHLTFPIELTGDKADEFAALHLIIEDMEFASKCLAEAEKLGIPDDENTIAKALIFSGLISYARAFDMGRRKFKLTPETFENIWSAESKELHAYLFDLRQKHIAHSINDCERCDVVGVIVTDQKYNRKAGLTGIGVTILTSIGLTKEKLKQANAHIQTITKYANERIQQLRPELHAEMKKHLDGGGAWIMAPLVRLPDSKLVGKRRD